MKVKFVSGGVTASGVSWRSETWREVPDDFEAKFRNALVALDRPQPDTIVVSPDFVEAYRRAVQ